MNDLYPSHCFTGAVSYCLSVGKLDMYYAQAKFHFLHEALPDISKLQ